MPEKAPKEYTPEYCTSIYERMHAALEAAVTALTLSNTAQKDLTKQTVNHLEDSFARIEDSIEKHEIKHKDHKDDHKSHDEIHRLLKESDEIAHAKLETKMTKLKVQFYAGGITALIFLMGFAFTMFKMFNPQAG